MNIYTKSQKYKYEAHKIADKYGKNSDVFGWVWDESMVDYESGIYDLYNAIQGIVGIEAIVTHRTMTGRQAQQEFDMSVIPPRLTKRLTVVMVAK